jgi:hypothetical protein
MKTVYKVQKPYSGTYTDADSADQLLRVLASEAWEAYLILTQNQPCVQVAINSDGSQVWKNIDGDVIPSPDDIQREIEEQAKYSLPITVLGGPQ